MNKQTITLPSQTAQLQQLDSEYFDNCDRPAFLQALLEEFIDGILILTEQRELIHTNERAKQIFQQLSQCVSEPNLIPEAIWWICQSLIELRSLFPAKTLILSDEIIAGSTAFRIRVRWLRLAEFERACLLVTLEEQCQNVQVMAIAEAQKFGLTPSETKVWLLYRGNYTYKQIAAELYVSLNTVKKHMKNIHAKRQTLLINDEY